MNQVEVVKQALAHGIKLEESSVRLNESGVDFLVAYGTDQHGADWVLRMPRRPESMRNAVQEKKALDMIQAGVRFEVPVWTAFSDTLIGYARLTGEPAAVVDPELQDYRWHLDKDNVPDEYYTSLGAMLAAIHALPVQPFQEAGMPVLMAEELRTSMKNRMDQVNARFDIHPARWERWQKWLADDDVWPAHTGVKHGDVHPGHILIDETNRATGLIDWTEVGVADVSVDFLAHRLIFGEEGLDKLLAAYEKAGGKTWPKMAAHINELLTTSAITVAEYAEASGLSEMHEAAKQMLASKE